MAKTIGLLGGTFDPIHFGHLNLALELKEKHGLDQVWFIPAQMNPFKTSLPPMPMQHRLEMIRLAIQDIPGLIVSDIEAHRPPPSYTVDTIKQILSEDKGQNQFYLLLGSDLAATFPQWHHANEIAELVPIIIGSRHGYNVPHAEVIPIRTMDISSTEIRQRLQTKMYCGHLVPAVVLQYLTKWT